MANVTWLSACVAADPAQVGGKALGLGQLAARDLPVPPGFAVTTGAYRRHVEETGLLADIVELVGGAATVAEQAAASRRIEDRFKAAGVCDTVATEVRAAYAQLGEVPVAVRSSADAEDTADASFAGQQESYLWVEGTEEVVRHLARCWASLFTPQAIAYRADRGIAPQDVAMGVVVQQMVPATAAGVMMTLDPVTGDRSQIAIEACYGLGVGVVSGEVTPDRWAVDKVTLDLRSRAPARKHGRWDREPGGGRIRFAEVAEELQELPCLSDGEVRRLAELGKRLERELGAPQDVEWAFGEGEPDGRELYLLQTRPETVWSRRPRAVTKGPASAMERLLATLQTPVRLKD
jgi:phosphoenolpyruvate synthase/pyruvate phosphate dikinase